jgi:hypothetical protein
VAQTSNATKVSGVGRLLARVMGNDKNEGRAGWQLLTSQSKPDAQLLSTFLNMTSVF